MKNTLIIARWEFGGMIRNRQFILFTMLFPLIFLVFGFLSIFLAEPMMAGSLENLRNYNSVDAFLGYLNTSVPEFDADRDIPSDRCCVFDDLSVCGAV